MRANTRRLGRISMSLTPKQAVLLWMREAHQYPTVQEYVKWKRTQPASTMPLIKMPTQVEQAARDATRVRPHQEVEWAVQRAVRDVVFLFHLHREVNARVMDDVPLLRLRLALIAQDLQRVAERRQAGLAMDWVRARVSMALTYPLDPETAATVEAAIRHHVIPWELVGLEGVEEWLHEHFVALGKHVLPWDTEVWKICRERGRVAPMAEQEVGAMFRSQREFEAFAADRDYHHAFADVTDAEWDRHYDHVVSALREMAASGEIEEGIEARLETVATPFLRATPLVEGEWLDAAVAEMAEEGTRLAGVGREFSPGADSHPLAPGGPVFEGGEGGLWTGPQRL